MTSKEQIEELENEIKKFYTGGKIILLKPETGDAKLKKLIKGMNMEDDYETGTVSPTRDIITKLYKEIDKSAITLKNFHLYVDKQLGKKKVKNLLNLKYFMCGFKGVEDDLKQKDERLDCKLEQYKGKGYKFYKMLEEDLFDNYKKDDGSGLRGNYFNKWKELGDDMTDLKTDRNKKVITISKLRLIYLARDTWEKIGCLEFEYDKISNYFNCKNITGPKPVDQNHRNVMAISRDIADKAEKQLDTRRRQSRQFKISQIEDLTNKIANIKDEEKSLKTQLEECERKRKNEEYLKNTYQKLLRKNIQKGI